MAGMTITRNLDRPQDPNDPFCSLCETRPDDLQWGVTTLDEKWKKKLCIPPAGSPVLQFAICGRCLKRRGVDAALNKVMVACHSRGWF